MTHIDLSRALRASVDGAYSDLVTRRTGAMVRALVERQLDGLADGSVAFLDFSHIGILDRSCADEFVAKLLLASAGEHPVRDGYLVLHGVTEIHLEAIAAVLDSHGLALVAQLTDGPAMLVGAVTPCERRLWELVMAGDGASAVEFLATAAGVDFEEAREHLESLAKRRLLRRDDVGFAPLGAAA